jgi:hypothetical protein
MAGSYTNNTKHFAPKQSAAFLRQIRSPRRRPRSIAARPENLRRNFAGRGIYGKGRERNFNAGATGVGAPQCKAQQSQ